MRERQTDRQRQTETQTETERIRGSQTGRQKDSERGRENMRGRVKERFFETRRVEGCVCVGGGGGEKLVHTTNRQTYQETETDSIIVPHKK